VDLQVVEQVATLGEWISEGGVVVLSGAGLSTDSGIPDYRGPSGSARRSTPMTYQTFTRDPIARRRYWARSHLGWHTIGQARPNEGHRAVARWQSTSARVLVQDRSANPKGLHMSKHRVLLAVAVVVASYVPAASALALGGSNCNETHVSR